MIIDKRFNFNYDISEPRQKNNIVLFYLSTREKIKNDYITFPEAFSKNLVRVEEVNDKGIVRYLKVTNISDQKLLILDSEQIIGNGIRQNRVVNSTTLISEFSNVILKGGVQPSQMNLIFQILYIFLKAELIILKIFIKNVIQINSKYGMIYQIN